VRPEESWPWQLVSQLRRRGADVDDPEVVARTGWTSEELLEAIRMRKDIFAARAPWDLVTILIGVNDQYRGLLPEVYRDHLREILDAAIASAAGPESVIVISIPDWSVTPFADSRDRAAIAAAIDVLNEVNREEAAEAGAIWIDVAPASRRASDDLSLIAEDGLHPAPAMYFEWTELILPAASEVLRARAGGSVAR
jgi:lysophospholipase L1-like esterase